jgi:hypothetical protein
MTYLFEINDRCLDRYDDHKYWTDNDCRTRIAYDSDYIIECRSDGSFFYIKNRFNGSTEVLPRDGSYQWVTIQMLKSRPYVRKEFRWEKHYLE